MFTLIQDLGMRFPTQNSPKKYRYGIYKCDECGHQVESMSKNMKQRKCICSGGRHGQVHHRLYNTWNGMMNRCNNPKASGYENYGGKGVIICKRWFNINNFIEDMYPSFKEGLTLDRRNPYGNYEPSNCRWASSTTQARNTRLLFRTNTSGYRGVVEDKRYNIWMARIWLNNKPIHLGNFSLIENAVKAYDMYIINNGLEHPTNRPKEYYIKENTNG